MLSVELNKRDAQLFKMYCNALKIRCELSGCFNLVHVAILDNITNEQKQQLNTFLWVL